MQFSCTGGHFTFQTNGVDSGDISPYALLLDGAGNQIRIQGVARFLHKRPTSTFFGEGVRHSYIIEHPLADLCFSATIAETLLIFEATLINRSASSLHITQIGLQTCDAPLRVAGDPAAWHLSSMIGDFIGADLQTVLPSANEQYVKMMNGFNLTVPEDSLPTDKKKTDGRWRLFTEYLTLYTDRGRRGIFIAPTGEPEAYLQHELFVDGGAISATMFSDMCNVLLRPGQRRCAQSLIIAGGPFDDVGRGVMRALAHTHGSRTHRPPLCGWCSWYDLGRSISAESLTSTIQAIEDYGDALHMQVIQIDDGYQRHIGDWRANDKFPHGLTPIIQKIKKAGAMAGIWLAPVLLHTSLDAYKQNPHWLFKDEKGQPAHPLDIWGASSYPLDVTHPQVKAYLEGIIKAKLEEGFTYFKIDFNTIYANGRTSYDPTKTALQAHRDTYALYRRAMGEDAYLLACSSFDRGAFGFADASRTGTDSCANWADMACCIRETLAQNPIKYIAGDVIYALDPDVTYLKSALDEQTRRTWHSFVGLYGGLQLISDPMAERADQLRQFQILTPPAREKGRPFHAVTDRLNQRFGLIAHRPFGSFASVLIFNGQDAQADMMSKLDALLELGERFHVWSFWDEQYLGIHSHHFTLAGLPPHGCRLLRLTPLATRGAKMTDGASLGVANEPLTKHGSQAPLGKARGVLAGLGAQEADESLEVHGAQGMNEASPGGASEPLLIGSSLHISMGAAEVKDILTNACGIEIHLHPAGAADGSLYVYSDAPFAGITSTNCLSAVFETQGCITSIVLKGRSPSKEQIIRLNY